MTCSSLVSVAVEKYPQVAMLRWLWLNCREVDLPGVSRSALIIVFVIMPGVRS